MDKERLKAKKSSLFKKRLDLKKIGEQKLIDVLKGARKQKLIGLALIFSSLIVLSGGIVAGKEFIEEVVKEKPTPTPSATPSSSLSPTPTPSPTVVEPSPMTGDHSQKRVEKKEKYINEAGIIDPDKKTEETVTNIVDTVQDTTDEVVKPNDDNRLLLIDPTKLLNGL